MGKVTEPTPKPTTVSPTKKPTTGTPTKKPTTKAPTKSPTRKPTKPTMPPVPTKNPTPKPTKKTKAPSTGRPTKDPTTPPPTKPLPSCPNKKRWNKCMLINEKYKNNEEKLKTFCQRSNSCYYCGYKVEDLKDGYNCRPKYFGEKDETQVVRVPKSYSCPKDAHPTPYNCKLFSECPKPYEMTACRALNFAKGNRYKGNQCKKGFTTTYIDTDGKGFVYKVGKHVCAYNNGQCRAVASYYWARETLFLKKGYF